VVTGRRTDAGSGSGSRRRRAVRRVGRRGGRPGDARSVMPRGGGTRRGPGAGAGAGRRTEPPSREPDSRRRLSFGVRTAGRDTSATHSGTNASHSVPFSPRCDSASTPSLFTARNPGSRCTFRSLAAAAPSTTLSLPSSRPEQVSVWWVAPVKPAGGRRAHPTS
jgi:hypothetical protein